MRTFYSLTSLLLISSTLCAQTPRIIVQGSGGPQVFNTLVAALQAANADNILYLSGGDFLISSDVVIDHEVHIVGAGCHPDSAGLTGRTNLLGPGSIRFTTNASGSSATGLHIASGWHYGTGPDGTGACTDMYFSRCHFESYLGWGNDPSTSTFEQCWLQNGIQNFVTASSAVVRNCIVGGSMFSNPGNLKFEHCTVLCNGAAAANSYENCVFAYTGGPGSIGNASYLNCLMYNVTPFTTNQIGCVFSSTNPFVNNADVAFNWTDDLHLLPGSGGSGLATDGTDVGIHGGTAPFKAGFVPYNPHYTHLQIAPATDGNGNLPVNITVAAQNN